MSANMDIDDDDDLYATDEPQIEPTAQDDEQKPAVKATTDDLEEGEEEDEGDAAMDEDDDDDDSDSDIDIITERKDGTVAQPPPQPSKYSDIRNIPQRSAASDEPSKPAPVKKEEKESKKASVSHPTGAPTADKDSEAASKSKVDINANPIHPVAGKPITQVNIDEDLPDNEKPWRKPGTDISDYFNYGFDEFTWALYAAKQESVRGEFGGDTTKKMMDDFNMMMMGGMGMGGQQAPQGGNPQQGGMPGMDGMPPEMQAMMQQMMAQGMDPSQMDPQQMQAMMASMQGGGQGGQGGQGQYGGGYGGDQGAYGGYDQGMGQQQGGGGGGGGRGRGGYRGRGRRGGW